MYSDEVLERFWAKVDKKGPDDCWEWTAYKNKCGYGTFQINYKMFLAHRISLQIKLNREITEGLVVKHACDNKCCVNPNHLSEGTQSENVREAFDRGLQTSKKGSDHYYSKLDESKVLEIRKLYSEKSMSQREIGEKFGVAQQIISGIVLRKSWKHI